MTRPAAAPGRRTISGFRRPNGTIGVRNHVVVMPTVYCANETARLIAVRVPGVVTLTHPFGCDEPGPDPRYQGQVINTLVGIAENPNVVGALVLGLGCEVLQPSELIDRLSTAAKPVECLVIQETGGTIKTVTRGAEIVAEMVDTTRTLEREEIDIGHITVALDCGGSDATSGIAANPAVGVAVDLLVEAGGSAILTEPGEMIGTEEILCRRALRPEVERRIRRMVANEEKRWKALDSEPTWMSPGNVDGGLTTIEEKSLGAIQKGGSSPICGVLENGLNVLEKPGGPGLYLQDGTGADVHGVTHMVAAGAQLAIFTTGRGSTIGFATAPVIKVTGNPRTFERMEGDMDVNAGAIITGGRSIREVGEEIFEMIVRVASGDQTKSESLGLRDFEIYGPNPLVNKMLGINDRL